MRAAAGFQGLRSLTVLKMTGVFAVYQLLGITSFYLLARAVPLDISFGNVGWIRTYVLLITTLPISILGLGVREGALIFMLQVYGVTPAAAVAYSF